ncbi:MAG: O-acetyl-ADP-ribose deacetylase [Candidatus Aminicenantes bacterium]|nr:MAG: O-acetyl-ADP-ribose deacetylase [Candidatus Aminicenantes bacterium]
MKEWTTKSGRQIKLVEGNIALLEVEAIVNAANSSLILGGGVAGAIRTYGGPSIQEECNKIGPVEVGSAVITGAGNLKAKYVIHAVGPVYGEGDEDNKLTQATLNSLKIAANRQIKSIAFPAISTGIFRFPLKRCSEIMLKTALEFIKNHEYPQEIIFCLYGQEAYSVFQQTLAKLVQEETASSSD